MVTNPNTFSQQNPEIQVEMSKEATVKAGRKLLNRIPKDWWEIFEDKGHMLAKMAPLKHTETADTPDLHNTVLVYRWLKTSQDKQERWLILGYDFGLGYFAGEPPRIIDHDSLMFTTNPEPEAWQQTEDAILGLLKKPLVDIS